jgi:RNA polymerase sigma-70 factor (ECF subfamily)
MLHQYAPRILEYLQRQLPAELRRIVEPQDVLQDTFFEAFQRLEDFTPDGDEAVYRWLVTIARNRVVSLLRMQRRLKRGGGRGRQAEHSDVLSLLEQLLVYSRTPSQSAMSHDLVLAVQSSIDRLPESYRDVIRCRFLEGLTIKETAARMGRTEGAILMLCNRGLRALKEQMEAMLPT